MIAVTGASGHIGNVLVRELLNRGEKVRVLLREESLPKSLEGLEVEIVTGDIRNIEDLRKLTKGVNIVYHLAAIISIMQHQEKLLHDVNVEGTKNVIQACKENKVKRLVYTSSIHAIHEPEVKTIIDETQPFDPENARGFYDKTKALASLEVLKAGREGLDVVIVSPTGVIGPYDFGRSLLGEIVFEAVDGKLKSIINGAYDFVDVRDVAVGHILAAEKGKSGENYILSGHRVTIPEYVKIIENALKKKLGHNIIPIWLAKLSAIFAPIYYLLNKKEPSYTLYSIGTLESNSFISNEKAKKELGFRARSIEESVKDAINWIKENSRK